MSELGKSIRGTHRCQFPAGSHATVQVADASISMVASSNRLAITPELVVGPASNRLRSMHSTVDLRWRTARVSMFSHRDDRVGGTARSRGDCWGSICTR